MSQLESHAVKTWIINGHGTYDWNFDLTHPVPHNVDVVFFKDSGGKLRMERSWKLYEAIAGGKADTLTGEIRSVIRSGYLIPDFNVTGDAAFPCGAMQADVIDGMKVKKPLVSLLPQEKKRAIDMLKEISDKGGGTVYWVACTEVASQINPSVVNGYIDKPRPAQNMSRLSSTV